MLIVFYLNFFFCIIFNSLVCEDFNVSLIIRIYVDDQLHRPAAWAGASYQIPRDFQACGITRHHGDETGRRRGRRRG